MTNQSWGYSYNKENWHTGFCDRDQAIEAAIEECDNEEDIKIMTALCMPVKISYPNFIESVVEFLTEGYDLIECLINQFQKTNDDDEVFYEDSLDIILCDLDYDPVLIEQATNAVRCSLGRAGITEDGQITEEMLTVIERDRALASALRAFMEAWVVRNRIDKVIRMLEIEQEEEYWNGGIK